MNDKECSRCKAATPTYEFERDTTFWGVFRQEVEIVTTRSVRVFSTYWRRTPPERLLRSEEDERLCSDCWNLFIARFLKGRSVDAMPGKEKW